MASAMPTTVTRDALDLGAGATKNAEGRRAKNGERSPVNPALTVATPSRGGRGGRDGGNRDKYASILEDIMKKRGVDDAWTALEEMQNQGTTTDKYTVSRMLMKTVGDARSRLNASRVYRSIGLVEKFIELQPKDVDEVLLNALLDTCCRLKDLNRLESIMERMRNLDITASPVTLGILVKTYGQAGDIQKVLSVWDEMEKQRGQANAVTYGCMIDACVKCGHLDKAVEIFQGMRESGKHRNTILYTTLIKGYGLDKNLPKALELFREMPYENVPYNTITYNSIIDACVKGGDLTTAESLLGEILSPHSNLEPDLITFSTLLKGYCHQGDLDKALQLVEAIKQRGLRCDELVYNTLMDGCVKANDVAAGVGLFEEMVRNGMRPSAITHSILARLYQRAGYDEDANEAVAQLYYHHGIDRPTAGERGKGRDGRRGSRSTPTASPMHSYGMNQDNGNWNSWNDQSGTYGAFGDMSAASTPCGSPMHSTGGQANNGVFLPMDAMRQLPPLPGMGGSETPYSNASFSPMAQCSGYGSYMASPCMSPTNMDQNQCQGMIAVPASPAQQCGSQMMPNGQAGLPQMPAWPFQGAMSNVATQPQGSPTGMDSQQVPQFFAVQSTAPMMQQGQGMMQGGSPANFMQQQQGAMLAPMAPVDGQMPIAQGPNPGSLTPATWQPHPHQNGCPVPLASPQDMGNGPNQQQGQAFFEMMPGSQMGQNTPVGDTGAGTQNPFCL